MAGPAGVTTAGPVGGTGIVCFQVGEAFFHEVCPFSRLGPNSVTYRGRRREGAGNQRQSHAR